MSEDAAAARVGRRCWARPGSNRDRRLRLFWLFLPVLIGALVAVLGIAPLLFRREVSFVLAKDKVAKAGERLRVTEALYRGRDDKNRPFSVQAGSALQPNSRTEVVRLGDLSARMLLDTGPALLRAPTGLYDMSSRQLDVTGPLLFETADGYRLTTRNVAVDLAGRQLQSRQPVEGRMPLGTFAADRLAADLDSRTVALEGRARLHIDQGGAKGPR